MAGKATELTQQSEVLHRRLAEVSKVLPECNLERGGALCVHIILT